MYISLKIIKRYTHILMFNMRLFWEIFLNKNFWHFYSTKNNITQKILSAKCGPPTGFPPELNSTCYLSLTLVCSLLENRSLVVVTARSPVASWKKTSRPIRNFPLRAHWLVTCFEAYAYTSRFKPCDMRACSTESKRGFTQDEWLYQSISRFDNCT